MSHISYAQEIWFITGSQHLYGEESLQQVADDAQYIVNYFNEEARFPVKLVNRPVLTKREEITNLCQEANYNPQCIGLMIWMHTFSPAKMWIEGLKQLQKPFLHLHTQYTKEIPWSDIDMDYMNLNQSAHGGREFGFLNSRMHLNRKVVAGYYQDPAVRQQIGNWIRAALAYNALKNLRVARFGDNMRNVAVTEGNKVDAQIDLGFAVDGYGVNDLADYVIGVSDASVETLISEYKDTYHLQKSVFENQQQKESLYEAARIEAGMKRFLTENNYQAFTTTFEDLHGLKQLPGLAVQRLMQEGYGFGAEGDWKTAALLRVMKVMAEGQEGGTSFMEDYTYHFSDDRSLVLGAHMLEVCPSVAKTTPSLEVHPLPIGGKDDPARLVFNTPKGDAVNVALMDMGDHFRLLTNKVEVVDMPTEMPKLPVARVLWHPKPSLEQSATAWIYAGGSHHTVFSQGVSVEQIKDLARMADLEHLIIDKDTQIDQFLDKIRWNEMYYKMRS